jgi:hypothetical protein
MVNLNRHQHAAGDKYSDGDGAKMRRKACESVWYTCDSRRKVPTVGHLGDVEPVTARDYISDRDARQLELSVGYHAHTNHVRTLFLSSLHYHHLTSSSSGVILIFVSS